MSDTPTTPTNPRNRSRRLRLFAPVFVLVAVLGYSSLSQPWYVATMRSATVLNTPNVSATVTLTGTQLAQLSSTTSSSTASVSTSGANPKASQHLGILDPVFWLMVAMLLGALGVWATSTLLGLCGLVSSLFAWQALTAIRGQVEQPSTWGSFQVVRGLGQSRLWFALTLGLLLLVGSSAQAYLAKRHVRAAKRAENPSNDLSVVTLLTSMVRGGMREAAAKAAQHEQVRHDNLV